MPVLEPVGRKDVNYEPVIVPVIGYDLDKKEHIFELICRPVAPLGVSLKIARQSTIDADDPEKAIVPTNLVLDYISACIDPECEEAWSELLDSPDIFIDLETLADVYRVLSEHYTKTSAGDARPTRPSSSSRTSPKGGARTSPGNARGRGSTSTRSR